jgi:signal transduction histidine kinase
VKILIADDNTTNRKLLRVTLEAAGHRVHEAADGREALASLEGEPVDAIISDVLMPNLDGYRLCHEVRKSKRFGSLPFIFYTNTYLSPADEQLALRLGGDKFLRKPASVQAITDALKEVTTGKRLPKPAPTALVEEMTVLKEYSAGLVAKLEEKNIELEQNKEELRTVNGTLEQRVSERTARLQVANDDLEAFAYTVSHDLRAPLRHIDGFVGLLHQSVDATVNSEGRKYLENISGAARQMSALIDGLLALARMGRVEMSAACVNLDAMVNEVIGSLAPETERREIVWKLEPLPTAQGDPALLRQVWVNLISNALKYSRHRAPARIEIGSQSQPGEDIFVVRDNGAGFDMKYAAKLFGVFQRLHSAEDFEGTGIGLATVRRIIQRHGGRTWAEGVVDRGAAFYFSLPKSPKGS